MFDPLAHAIMLAILALVGWGMSRATRFATRSPILPPRAALGLHLLPVALYAFYCVKLLVELALDPTSNNLWPIATAFLTVVWFGWAALLAGALVVAGRFVRRP